LKVDVPLEVPEDAKTLEIRHQVWMEKSAFLTFSFNKSESAVWKLTIVVLICKTDWSEQVQQKVNGTVILPPLVFPGYSISLHCVTLSCKKAGIIFGWESLISCKLVTKELLRTEQGVFLYLLANIRLG
jgi:hypothetical protein